MNILEYLILLTLENELLSDEEKVHCISKFIDYYKE